MTEEQKQEHNAQDTVSIVQALELALMVLLLGEIKTTLKNPQNKSQSIANIRKGTKKQVTKYLPLLIASSKSVLENNYRQITSDLKGKIPPSNYKKQLKETEDYFKKYINTKGTNFIVGKGQKLPQFFVNFINDEVKNIVDGTMSMNEVIEKAIKQLADNGLMIVNYDSGIRRNVDVFVRQQMLYAQKESTQDIRNQFAKDNGITIFEFDAHPNARPSHKLWQGKRYDTTGKYYPTLEELTHGEEKDYGCKHRAYPVWNKDDAYMFTKEQLKNLDTKPFTWDGKEYNGYDATQKQRLYERQIRRLKRNKALYEEIGSNTKMIDVAISRKRREYNSFCKKMGTYPRNDRLTVGKLK